MTMRMRRVTAPGGRIARACALGVLLWAAPAAAQNSEIEPESFNLPGWSFTPSMGFGLIYDSNVALSSPRADLGSTEGGTLVSIVPGGQLEFNSRRSEFAAKYRGFIRRYPDFEGLNGFDQRASLNARRAMTRRLTLFARDVFNDSPTTVSKNAGGTG